MKRKKRVAVLRTASTTGQCRHAEEVDVLREELDATRATLRNMIADAQAAHDMLVTVTLRYTELRKRLDEAGVTAPTPTSIDIGAFTSTDSPTVPDSATYSRRLRAGDSPAAAMRAARKSGDRIARESRAVEAGAAAYRANADASTSGIETYPFSGGAS